MIHYFSQTGNTKLLGDFLKDNINDSKTIYVGFWTDKGNANQEALDYLKNVQPFYRLYTSNYSLMTTLTNFEGT